MIVILGDFNAKSSNWYKHDKTTCEGSKIEAITSQFGLKQSIQEPIHIVSNSSSCIDLVFASQPNLVMESRLHSSLHENCHHQLVYAKFNLKVWYPPPFEREIWHYQYANIEQIKRAIEQFPWEKTIKSILSNYIPHETITCDDREPTWINNKIKQLIQEINNTYRIFIRQQSPNISEIEVSSKPA